MSHQSCVELRHKRQYFGDKPVPSSAGFSLAPFFPPIRNLHKQNVKWREIKLHKFNREIRRYCKRLEISKPEQLSALIKNIEPDQKDIPPLVKHYMKLGGRFCSFSVDENFGGTLDGLIVVDLPKAPDKSLLTYLGENFQKYQSQHITVEA